MATIIKFEDFLNRTPSELVPVSLEESVASVIEYEFDILRNERDEDLDRLTKLFDTSLSIQKDVLVFIGDLMNRIKALESKDHCATVLHEAEVMEG